LLHQWGKRQNNISTPLMTMKEDLKFDNCKKNTKLLKL
jgi:hypothetical protein